MPQDYTECEPFRTLRKLEAFIPGVSIAADA
jgi:hypothetical protein